MDWNNVTQIVVAVLGLLGAVDLLRLLFVKEDKKNKQVQNVDAEVQVAQHANDLLSKQLDNCHETITNLNAQNEKLQGEKAELLSAQSCLFDDMCIHKGCRIRKPHQGQGSEWYKKYREDPNLGADYQSIDTLLRIDRASRKRAVDEAENAEEPLTEAGGAEAN